MQLSSTLYFSATVDADATAIAAEVSRLFPGQPDQVSAPGAAGENDNLLRIGDTIVAILNLDLPQPSEALEDAFKVNFAWPEAKQVIAQHTSHVMLVVMGEQQGFDNALVTSRTLAMASLALANLQQAMAIYWPSSMALLRGQSVLKEVEAIRDNGIALGLWLAFKPWIEREGSKVGLFTSGLRGLVGREIEIVARSESLFAVVERAVALAHYMLTPGTVVRHGDTIGYSSTEQLKIRFVEDGSEPLMQVLTEETAR